MIIKTKNIVPFILIFLFVLPASILAFIPIGMRPLYYYFILLLDWFVILLFFKIIFLKKENSFLTPFTLMLIFTGLLGFFVKNDISLFNIIFPILGFAGYKIIINERIEFPKLFNIYFFFLYLVFYNGYYSILPDFFYRPGFNEDILNGASSNAIPFSLNNSLLIYMALNFLYKWKASKSILIIAIINLLLNIIQQGRGGIFVGVILLSIAFYEYAPMLFYRFRSVFILIYLYMIYISAVSIITYIDAVNISDYSLLNETRIIAQLSFLNQITYSNFFFGFQENTWFDNELYTYSMFLDFWNKYNFISFCVLIFLFLNRLYNYKKFLFPLYYLFPILFYSFLESIYLPGFYDFLVYLILFLPKNYR
tara:strand:+ start:13313 stop:14410 length:1098 start_codon:yes stop_codon:yes gene_type:complete